MQDRDDVLTCLVTGNLQPIGWAKMEALGIKHLFSEPCFGGFGSDYCNPDNSDQSWKDRAELVKIAAQKAEKLFPGVGMVSVAAHKRILHHDAVCLHQLSVDNKPVNRDAGQHIHVVSHIAVSRSTVVFN